MKVLCPPGWEFKLVPAKCYGDALRAIWPQVKDMGWVGLVSDDLVPASGSWDVKLIGQLQGWNFVSSNDGWQAPGRMHGATCWSGDLLRAVGWLFPPELRHIFHDDVWETLGRETGTWSTRMDIMVKHLHEALGGVIGPTMDRNSALWKHDEAVYKTWLENDKDAVAARIKQVQANYKVRVMTPDFKEGTSVMVGTPSIDGKYESAYVIGLYQTMQLFAQHKIGCQWAEEKYTADIALGRSKLFAAFLRSTATHFLMVDSDMGWEPDAILRLFYAKKDFVAIAGPKKRYPLQFAASYTDKRGQPIPLQWEDDSGTMEVGEVGMAFCLITRACAERIANAYPELVYGGVTGEKEFAVFMPLVKDGRFYSEDFAFCVRWRAIGGHVHIVPDIRLKHVGSHTFEGSFSQGSTQGSLVPTSPLAEAAD
jgi:hypothetical protein